MQGSIIQQETQPMIVEKLYEFENTKGLLDFTFEETGIPYWMLVRFMILRNVAYQKAGQIVPHSNRVFKTYIPKGYDRIKRSVYCTTKKEVVFAFYDNSAFAEKDGKIGDHRMLPYMNYVGNKGITILDYVFEDPYQYKNDYCNWKSSYSMRKKLEKQMGKRAFSESKKVKAFIAYLEKEFPYPLEFELRKKIFNHLRYAGRLLPVAISEFETYLDIVKPKLVVLQGACYLDPAQVAMIWACREKNIKTAEIQHGYVGRDIEAYNCGEQISQSEMCKRIYPDYFLTRGEFWNKRLNVPVVTVVVGNHKMSTVKERLKSKNVLIICSAEVLSYTKIAEIIKDSVGEGTVYFRLHPNLMTEEYVAKLKMQEDEHFKLANEYELNYYLNLCQYVVVGRSTIVYEALSVGRIVFFYKEKGTDEFYKDVKEKVFGFEEFEELKQLWEDREKLEPTVCPEFYDNRWKELYGSFLSSIGIE